MIAILKLVPIWVWAVVGLIAALLTGLIYQTLALSDARQTHSEYVTGIAEAKAQAEKEAREEEARRQTAIDEVKANAQQQIKNAAADAAISRGAANSLQQQVDKLLANRSAQNSKLAAGSQTIDRLTIVLAQLRKEADDYAGELATALESSRIAGFACEQSYDSLSSKLMGQ